MSSPTSTARKTMAPKPKKPTPEDLAALQSEVASFASSLGLAPPHLSTSSGFDDSDFLKSGPLKPPTNPKLSKTLEKNNTNTGDNRKPDPKPNPKPHPLQIDPFPTPFQSKKLPDLPLMKPSSLSGQWYVDADELESRVFGEEGKKKVVGGVKGVEELEGLVVKKRELGERLMEQYMREYEAGRRKNGDMRLLEMTARSGTSADKVSAFTCLVEDNPIASLRSLDALLSMITSKVGKRYAFTGFEALKELFLLRLLPDRKLKCLIQRPLNNLPETKDGFSLLLFWHWEECLKQRYERFIIALEEALKDMLPSLKDKAMKTVYALLKSKSEQERRLLSAIVNKLGDPERKAASGAGYQLSCLLSAHPNMKAVVIEEVDSFIFRPHIGLRAKYQAVNFLNQILLSKRGDGPKIAKRLVDVYFALFKVLLSEAGDGKKHKDTRNDKFCGKKKYSEKYDNNKNHSTESHIEMDSRLLSALLTGVNRAFPFVSSDEADDIIEVQTPVLFRLVHSENFNVGVQALMLLYQISSKNQVASDRFYRALYAKLLTPATMNFSKPEMFLGLLIRAMKNDINLKRISAFSKRLMQVALQRPPQFACGCLFLLSELLKAKPPLWTMVLQRETVDDELEHFEDVVEDPEDASNSPSGRSQISSVVAASKDSGELKNSNHKKDYNSDSEDCLNNGNKLKNVTNGNKLEAQAPNTTFALPAGYNPRHREPSYCNADCASWWELTILASHVHPSVATMARTLLSGATIVYNGDPLSDLSLNAFLDKFMEKKPKPNKKAEGRWHGGSQIAPARKLNVNHHLIGNELLELAEEDVSPEDVVFHRFYMNKTSSSKKRKAKKKASEEEDDDDAELLDASDESGDEEEIDNMLGSGHLPMAVEEGEYDYDDLDRVADEDDDDLIENESDEETIEPSSNKRKHSRSGSVDDVDDDDDDGFDMILGSDDDEDNDDGDVGIGSDEDGSNQTHSKKKRKKSEGKSKPSPFANLEEYEHLMNDGKGSSRNKSKLPKKKKKSKV